MVIKVYLSMISCSQEVKKNQQRAVMILESKNIPFTTLDITDPGQEDSKDYMNDNAKPKGDNKVPMTPQIFNEADYCGDFDELDMANETDTLGEFLKLTDEEKKGIKIGITGILPEERARAEQQKKEGGGGGLSNGVSAGRENEKTDATDEIIDTNAVETEPTEEPAEAPEETIEAFPADTNTKEGEDFFNDTEGALEGTEETVGEEKEERKEVEASKGVEEEGETHMEEDEAEA